MRRALTAAAVALAATAVLACLWGAVLAMPTP